MLCSRAFPGKYSFPNFAHTVIKQDAIERRARARARARAISSFASL